uniref:IQ motif containing H n=1 Tax=Junco hyemalis TaxID=40217 RepID=A0A8C5NRC7_JUNHY
MQNLGLPLLNSFFIATNCFSLPAGIAQELHLLAGALSPSGQRLMLPAAPRALPAPPAVPRAAPGPQLPRQHKKPALGEFRALQTTFSCTSSCTARFYLPLTKFCRAQSTGKASQPFQDPCLDIAAHQKAPGVLALQHLHHSSWQSTVGFLEPPEKLLKDHSVPLATINSQKMAQISSDLDFKENPTKSAILSVMKNQSAVEETPNGAGQGGSAGAAAGGHRGGPSPQQQWAAGVLSSAWRSWIPLARRRGALREARRRHLENFCSRAKHLAANWNRIRTSRRTIIHIPSLGYSQHIREHIPDLAVQQNLQMGRLCDILDANVDVIYICPLALSEELLQYYNKLLGLQAAVRSGSPEDMADLQDRFRILTPEAINSFPEHHMCLATVLKYSPRTLQRLQGLLRGRDAYMVGGVPHLDELAVADQLQVPLLGSQPAVAQLCSTKSGSKRIFASAGVPTPPGEGDIRSSEQLLRALGRLLLDHPEVQRWLLKVDDERAGDGTAFCDVTAHLECHPWIQREQQEHGLEVWSESQARELALVKISQELPGLLAQHVQPVNEKRFPTWEKFLQTFLTQGGVIEAFPCSGSVTNLTVDLLIEPSGELTLLASGEQLHAEGPLRCSGTTIPQRSVDPGLLQALCLKVGEACKAKGVLGYFSVDFVAFTHPQTGQQQVWATDLDLGYSDQLALSQLLVYLTDGNVDRGSSILQAPLGAKESPSQGQFCLHLQEKQGTVFVLYEDQKRHSLGMITIGEDLQGVLLTFARNLFIIHQEISAPNMQGETNFKMAIRDIEAILGVTAENKLRLEEEQPWEADALKE